MHVADPSEQAWRSESKQRLFVRTYFDNEVEEEDKRLQVRRTRESMPFGMNIRKAAYKAAFGVSGSHPVLQRYVS